MNPSTEPPHLQPPPQPPQPSRPSTSCDRHPDESFTGFCPSCLCERLAVLDISSASAASSSSSRKPPSSAAAAAVRPIFKPSNNNTSTNTTGRPSFLPELRRTKSFSASKNEGFSGVFEPQRKSCDVRGRNTLWSLFNQDDEKRVFEGGASTSAAVGEVVEPRISTSSVRDPVIESKEEEAEGEEEEEEGEGEEQEEEDREEEVEGIECARVNDNASGDFVNDNGLEKPTNFSARKSNAKPIEEIIEEIEEEEEEEDEGHIVIEPEPEPGLEVQEEEVKTMKDHIHLDSQSSKKLSGRDFKEIAGNFWSAASVFSKKLQKWRQKQKMKKLRNENGGPGSATLPVEKPLGRQYRETQSEIADYGFGRRSCDTDPRFSVDAGRISFDDPRYSFDEPRASWDGYLMGRTFPRMPTMLSVVENAPVNVVTRSDTQIPVEEPPRISMNSINEDECVPGGSTQTRDYYLDSSSSRRRRSLDRSNSIRQTAAAVVADIDELKSSVSNSKVSPATVDYFQGPKLDRDSNSNSLRNDCSFETFDKGFRDNASVVGNGEGKEAKKSRRWGKAWNIWGFIHRRSVNKEEDEDRCMRVNGVERSFSESWPELRGELNGDVRGGFNPKLVRSNSNVSWRSSQNFGGGSFNSARKSNVETNGQGRKKRDEFVLERNRSARYSPNNLDNGLLRFYLTPMRSSRRGGWGKSKPNHAHSIARSVLRLY